MNGLSSASECRPVSLPRTHVASASPVTPVRALSARAAAAAATTTTTTTDDDHTARTVHKHDIELGGVRSGGGARVQQVDAVGVFCVVDVNGGERGARAQRIDAHATVGAAQPALERRHELRAGRRREQRLGRRRRRVARRRPSAGATSERATGGNASRRARARARGQALACVVALGNVAAVRGDAIVDALAATSAAPAPPTLEALVAPFVAAQRSDAACALVVRHYVRLVAELARRPSVAHAHATVGDWRSTVEVGAARRAAAR